MWKRWSIKPSTGVALEEDKAKHHTAAPGPSDQGPSTTLVSEVKAANVNGVEQETASGPQEQTDKAAEGHGISIGQVPIPNNPVDESGEQSTAPVRNGSPLSSDSPRSVPSSTHQHAESATSPSTAPSPAKTPSEARPKGASSPPTPGSVFIPPAVPNTPSPPGSESSNVPSRARRLSFRSFAFFYGHNKEMSPNSISYSTPLSMKQDKSNSSTPPQPKRSRAEKEAFSSAIVLRTLIIGPTFTPAPSTIPQRKVKISSSKSMSTQPLPDLKKVKGQLLDTKSANAIISQLRRLPVPDDPSFHACRHPSSDSLVTPPHAGGAPIHAVCLPCTDEEAEKIYFSRLRTGHNLSTLPQLSPDAKSTGSPPSVGVQSLASLVSVLKDLHLVSLVESPDLGFGQPVRDGDSGFLSGSVPSPETVANGFEQITEQLMNLGFATSKAFAPNHTGIYPPTDRMSVLTCE